MKLTYYVCATAILALGCLPASSGGNNGGGDSQGGASATGGASGQGGAMGAGGASGGGAIGGGGVTGNGGSGQPGGGPGDGGAAPEGDATCEAACRHMVECAPDLVGDLARCVDGCQQSSPDQETLQCLLDARCDEFPEAFEQCAGGGEEPPDPGPDQDAGVAPDPDVFVNEPHPDELTCEAVCHYILECLPDSGFPLDACIQGCQEDEVTQEQIQCVLDAPCNAFPDVLDECAPVE